MSEKKELVNIEENANPKEIVKFGQSAAAVLKDVVDQAGLLMKINNQSYMKFEGWQTVARFFKTTVGIEWTRPICDNNDKIVGFEARANVFDEEGKTISSAESYCGKDEANWKTKPDYALRSMAQTRASAKALRQVYSWVVVLAGYKPTPAEEMDGINPDKQYNVTDINVNKDLMKCSKKGCGQKLTEKVYKYSLDKFGKPLCYDHQPKD